MELMKRGRFMVATMPQRVDAMTSPDIERILLQTLEGGETWMACDYSNTEYISSAGLRVMLLVTKRSRAAGGRFVLFALRNETLEVFKMAGFDTILELSDALDA